MAEGFQPGGRAPAPPPLDLVQDFVNTEIPDWARDDIATPEALGEWLRARDLLADGEHVEPAAFVAARALRAALRDLAYLNTVGERPGQDERARLAADLAPVSLAAGVDARGELCVVAGGDGAMRALAEIVAVAVEAQVNGTWERLKACRQDTCRWLFFDVSRNRSSSWCSMSICGNRAKTAAYRRRRGGAR